MLLSRAGRTLFLGLLLCFSMQFSVLSAPVPPLASGTFWQLGVARLESWSDAALAAEVYKIKQAGMNFIILQYSAVWEPGENRYQTYIPEAGFSLFPGMARRDPLDAIFKAAETYGVKIILGDFLLPPPLRYSRPEEAFNYWLSEEAMRFRKNIIERFKDSPSFYGYYIPNEPNPYRIPAASKRKTWIRGTERVTQFVKTLKSDLLIIHPIGLYAEWHTDNKGVSQPFPPSVGYLNSFWEPWFQAIPQIDIWMVIDGIGTRLSDLTHTDKAQAWGKSLAQQYDKEFWVDVENAVMGKSYSPFTMPQLMKSLQIAAKYADEIVFFEHLSYMSSGSNNLKANQLFQAYIHYREKILDFQN